MKIEEIQEVLEERKRRGFNMVDMETAENLWTCYIAMSELCGDNATIALDLQKENVKLKEALRPFADFLEPWDNLVMSRIQQEANEDGILRISPNARISASEVIHIFNDDLSINAVLNHADFVQAKKVLSEND